MLSATNPMADLVSVKLCTSDTARPIRLWQFSQLVRIANIKYKLGKIYE